MRIVITESQFRNILLEYEILPFREVRSSDKGLEYSFDVGDIKYRVTFLKSVNGDLYELGFGVVGQNTQAYRTRKDITHLNTVLNIVDAIVKDVVGKYGVKKIIFSGARGETDSDLPYIDPIRLNVYFRYVTRKYPNVKYDKDRFGNMMIYMNSIYPELFEDKMDRKEILLNLFMQINDASEDDDYWRFDQLVNGVDDSGNLEGSVELLNSVYGYIEIEITYYDGYELTIRMSDEGVEDEVHQFGTFEQMVEYLRERFLNN
jgi:hypothetical protein